MQTIKQAELHLLDGEVCVSGALEKAKASVVPYFTKDGTFSPPPPATSQQCSYLRPLQFRHGAADVLPQ